VRQPGGAVSSLVASGGARAAVGRRRRTGEAPHELFNCTLIVSSGLVGDGYRGGRSVLGCRYGLPRESVGSRHAGLRPRRLLASGRAIFTEQRISPSRRIWDARLPAPIQAVSGVPDDRPHPGGDEVPQFAWRSPFAGAPTGVGVGQPWRPFVPEPYWAHGHRVLNACTALDSGRTCEHGAWQHAATSGSLR